MTTLSKTKSYPKPIVDFESNLELLKLIKGFTQKIIQMKTTQTINKCV